jgi:hypothetical protein
MHQYDILRDTWIYSEIKQIAQKEIYVEYMIEQRKILQVIVQARFPRLKTLAQEVVGHVSDLATLQSLLIKVSSAKTEKEVRQDLKTAISIVS